MSWWKKEKRILSEQEVHLLEDISKKIVEMENLWGKFAEEAFLGFSQLPVRQIDDIRYEGHMCERFENIRKKFNDCYQTLSKAIKEGNLEKVGHTLRNELHLLKHGLEQMRDREKHEEGEKMIEFPDGDRISIEEVGSAFKGNDKMLHELLDQRKRFHEERMRFFKEMLHECDILDDMLRKLGF